MTSNVIIIAIKIELGYKRNACYNKCYLNIGQICWNSLTKKHRQDN